MNALTLTNNANRWFGRDAFGFSLNYFEGDYKAAGQSNIAPQDFFLSQNIPAFTSLYNGNIGAMQLAIKKDIIFISTATTI